MAKLTHSTFAMYELSAQESVSGAILPQDVTLNIQNMVCMIAEEKLALVPDPANYAAFIQQEAYLAGQLMILKHLIDVSIATQQGVVDKAKAEAGEDFQ